MLKLGMKVKDQVTGFQGILSALAEHLTGDRRGLVSSKSLQDGFMPAARWFDVRRLEIVSTEILVLKPHTTPKSTPKSAPAKVSKTSKAKK